MTPSAPTRPSERLLTSTLAVTCIALATTLALVSTLIVQRVTRDAPVADAPSISVFADAATPRATAVPDLAAAELASSGETAGEPALPGTAAAAAEAGDAPADDTSSPAAAAASAGETVFDEAVPATPVDPDRRSVELGLRFTPKVDGTISGIRFYRTDRNVGPHVGTLWGPGGEVLARVTFPESGAGWVSAEISPAVAVTAGRTYVASYLAPSGRYAADEDYFARGVDTETLTIPAGAGVYAYGSGAYPTSNYRNSNYYVDVTFTPATVVPDPGGEPGEEPSGEPTPGAEPTGPQPPAAPATGVFGDRTTPDRLIDPDRESVELGMRFVPKVDGRVTAIRFYRSAVNTGPHRGSLWDAEGNRLAQVEFGADEAPGWQIAELAQPVTVTAGRLYVVSYLAPAGRYSADEQYFDVGIDNAYFSVPVGAGVYAYGSGAFPTQNYRNSNYFVDVRFSPAAGQPQPSVTPTPTATPTPRPSATATPRPTATATPRPTPTVTPTPTPTPTPTTPPVTSVLDLPTEAWWGGAAYYERFDKARQAGWADPSFFPIAVFFGKPSHADELAAIGVNTYMGAEHDGSRMSMITNQGISVLAQNEWTPAEVGDDPMVVGWHVSDECEMGYSGCAPNGDEYARLSAHQRLVSELSGLADGRFLQANFGNGVLGTFWGPNTMDDHVGLVDVTSVDKYAYTSPHVQGLFRSAPAWPQGADPARAMAYGWQQDRMEQYMTPAAAKPNWIFVETAMPFLTEAGATSISGDQLEGAVWNGIIHGSAGIAYFQHNNNGRCGTYSLVDCGAAIRSKVAQVNADVTRMAPVLNSPSYVWDFGAGLDTSLKAYDGSAYILAMTDGGTGARSFRVPAGLSGNVEVVGENRTIPIVDGVFSDAFAAEHDHHIYRIRLAG